MIRKVLLFFCLIVYSESQTLQQQFKASVGQSVGVAGGGGGGQGAGGGPWVFDLPPLNLQPLQLRLNPSTTPADEPSLFLIRQNESIPVTSQDPSLQNWSQLPQTAPQQWNSQWTQPAAPQWTQPLQTFGAVPPPSPQTPVPPPQTQLQAPQIQPFQAVDQTKPLMPLAFQPLSQPLAQSVPTQPVSIPSPLLGLSVNGAPKPNPLSGPPLQTLKPFAQPINPSFVQNWKTPQQVTAPTTTAWAKPQLTQTFTNFGQKPLTPLSQPLAVQQNLQTLKRNDIPNTSAYELTDITPVLQSLAAYTPQPPNLSPQSQLFNQIPAQSVVGQQIAPQVTDKNTKYFPSVTLPAINLPSNELPVKLIDLSQLSQLSQNPGNAVAGIAGPLKNPDRSTWSSTTREKSEAATLIPQALTAPKPLSAFNSLQSNVWSKPSPLNSLLAKTQPIPQTLVVPNSPVVQQLPAFPDALTASVQSWAQSSQQTGPSPTNPVPPLSIPPQLLGLSPNGVLKPNPIQPLATPLQPLATPFQPLATPPQPLAAPPQPLAAPPQPLATPFQPLATPYKPLPSPIKPWAAPLQPIGTPVQPPVAPFQPFSATPLSAPIKPLQFSSPVSALPLQSIPLTVAKSGPLNSWQTGIIPQFNSVKSLHSVTPINPLPNEVVAPIQPLAAAQPFPAFKPLPAATSLKPWSSVAPIKPLPVSTPVQAIPQPLAHPIPQPFAQPIPQPSAQPIPQPLFQPVPLTNGKSVPLQSWPSSINQQLAAIKPLSAATPINPLPVAAVAQPIAPPKPLATSQPWLSHKPLAISTPSLKSWSSFAPLKH